MKNVKLRKSKIFS